jgi:outer membrane protein insertion porin family
MRPTRLAVVLVAIAAFLPGLQGSVSAAPLQESESDPESEIAEPLVDDPSPAPEQIVRRILVEGAERLDAAKLIGALAQPIGQALDEEAISRGIDVIWDLYHARAMVYRKPVGGTPEGNGDGVDLLLVVEELPLDLEPRFVGNVNIDLEQIWRWAELLPGEELYLDQADRVRERIARGYRQKGYFFVEVRAVTTEGLDDGSGRPLVPDVIFEIREGPRVRIREVLITGNESISNKSIPFFKRGLSKLAGIEMRGPRFFRLFTKAFIEETLDADLIALRTVYRDQGYLDAVVGLDRLEFSDDRRWVTVHLAVDEGARFTVGSISIEGVEQVADPEGGGWEERPAELVFPEEELRDLLEMKPGDLYDRSGEAKDLLAMRRHYGEQGYIYHASLSRADRWEAVGTELVFDEKEPIVHVIYRIAQGRQLFIREIRTAGNLHTQDRVLRRELSIEEGDVANPAEIDRSLTRLLATGYFSDPGNVGGHRDPSYHFEDTPDPNWKDLVYVVDEGQVLQFNISGGVSSNSGAFGVISYSQQNFDITNLPRSLKSLVGDVAGRRAFHGAGQELRIRASPGTEITYYDIYFREPDLLGRHQDRISGSILARRRQRMFRSHDEERDLIGFTLGRQIAIDSSIFGGYSFGMIEIDDLDTSGEPTLGDPLTVPALLKAQEGESDIAFLEFGYRRTTVDSRMNPKNGMRFAWVNELHSTSLGGDYEFMKSEVRFDWYDEFDEETAEAPDRYHLGFRAGVAVPFGDTDRVPYSERYHAGGQRFLRGFRYRGVGPNEEGYPIGGETFALFTAEYRRPLVTTTQPGTYREVETIQGGIFFDVGVLGVEDFELHADEVRMSAGFMFGFSVPLPITFSFGFPLRDGEGDRKEVFAFNIGFM